jgi:predicted nucleotidyltransferase
LALAFHVGPTFDSFMDRKVDLVTPDAPKPRLRPVVEREAVDVV